MPSYSTSVIFAIPSALTGAAFASYAAFLLVNNGVRFIVRMTVGTMSRRSVTCCNGLAPQEVLAISDGFQMAWPYTVAYTAEMIPMQAVGSTPYQEGVSCPRGRKATVTVRTNAGSPKPAVAEIRTIRWHWPILIDFRPESFFGCLRGTCESTSGRIMEHLKLILSGVMGRGARTPPPLHFTRV